VKGDDPAPEKVRQVRSGRKKVSAADGFVHNVDVTEALERELKFLSCFVVAAVTVRQAEFVRARLARGHRTLNAIESLTPATPAPDPPSHAAGE
jgi:hypothetical protein